MADIKLLLVEDDENLAYMEKSCFEDIIEGYEVKTAVNGRQGLEEWKTFQPDVIVSDIDMPIMDGLEMVRKIREVDGDTIILFTTGLTSPKDLKAGYAAGANNYVKKPEIKEKYFTIVEDEAQHLLALINRLLTISKLEHGKLNIQKTVVKLKPMIEDVTEKYKAKSAKSIHIATQLKVTTVAADEEYLKEAISNLIDNATKYSKEKINIRISTLEDNNYIYIKVYDEGIGISKSEQKSVFNRFERAAEHEKNGNKTRKGFGIGLNYVFQVVHAHGGKISLKSEKDKWTEFTIALPKVSDKQ